ncbi:Gastrula zinc finger protein XlCGF46.1 [Araneus ventricosus]|uniref:Gastrula zinc finger protein XlCGF46.1 n=1 Tax=Araneus ventricosus TaxID=182803 RepID=A0A4Y2R3R5_ARAVE|nr:Gastrula zinc finger protein XlCGF46.1 [Araneus ventricosus]
MDHPPETEQRYASPAYYVPAAEASAQTTYEDFILLESTQEGRTQTTDEEFILLEPTKEVGTQTKWEDFKFLAEIQKSGNTSMSTSDGSADTSEAISAIRHGYNNICGAVNSQGSYFSSSLEASSFFDMSTGSQGHPVPYDAEMVSPVHTRNRKRSVSRNRMTTENNPAHKRSRPEICVKSGKSLSTDIEQDDMNYDKALEINATSRIVFDNSHLAGIDHEIQTITESPSHNQEMRILSNLGKKTHLTIGQNISSNISIFEIAQNDNAPRKISDSVASKSESVRSVNDILAVAGTSGFHRNENIPNMSGETSQSRYPPEMPSIKLRKGKALTCMVCTAEISKHEAAHGENILYECCVCIYNTRNQINLQMQSFSHRPEKFCNICEKEHTEGDSHDGEHTCNVCERRFQCKTLLNEHSLDHKDYFSTHCWRCSRNVNDHFIKEEGKTLYVCCVCGYKTKNKHDIQIHNRVHRPKFFCKICREEYPIKEKGLHDSEYACMVCEEKFQCKTLLGDHSLEHKNYFHIYCRVCNRIIAYDHKIENEGKPFFKCCQCLTTFNQKCDLQKHLYTHTGVGLFKCEVCRRRYVRKDFLKKHSLICKPLPHKCQICKTRFPSSDFLDAHRLVKHRQT